MTTEEFLHAIFDGIGDGALEIWCASPKGVELKPRNRVLWKPLPLGDFSFAGSQANRLNHAGYGVSFGCCARRAAKGPEERTDPKTNKTYTMQHPRGNEQDSIYLPTLWIDIDKQDGGTFDDFQLIRQRPTIITSSGGGWHGYWLLDEPMPLADDNRDGIKRTLRGMAKKTKTDVKVAEFSRALRLPGTINTKPERGGAVCEVIEADLKRRYSFDEMAAYAFYAGPREPDYPITRKIPIEASNPLPKWIEGYLSGGAAQGERNHTLYRAARTYAEHGIPYYQAEQDLGGRAAADGLTGNEIRSALNSGYKNEPKAALPQHMRMRMSSADRKLKGKL